MELDYLFAVVLFVVIFSFAVMFISGNIIDQKNSVKTETAKEQADLIMNKIFSENSNISLISGMYKLYVYADNRNSSDVQEFISIDLNKFGKNDPNSVIIIDESNKTYSYNVGLNTIMFSSTIPASSTKLFVVYYYDDSNFPPKSSDVRGNDTIRERIYGPEKIYAVQSRKIEKIKNISNTSADNYHIDIFINNSKILEYGPEPDIKKNVVVKKKNVLIQFSNKLEEGWIVLSVWI